MSLRRGGNSSRLTDAKRHLYVGEIHNMLEEFKNYTGYNVIIITGICLYVMSVIKLR